MIDLKLTREQMLAKIRASEFSLERELSDPTSPEFAALPSFRYHSVKRTRSEVYGALCAGFAARFANIEPERVIRDITRPLKKALGNSYKRGNRGDPAKNITLDIVFTPEGVVVSASDEGEGFDFEAVCSGFREGKAYFEHHGDGFRCFENAESTISYADGGRTFLLCFRPAEGPSLHPMLGLAADEAYMSRVLAGELSRFKKAKAVLESCRVFVPTSIATSLKQPSAPELRYVLQYSKRDGKSEKSEVLTARLLSEQAAKADFENARRLYEGPFKSAKGVEIPKPQNAFKQHPRLVFYTFDPTCDLFGYLTAVMDQKRVEKAVAKVAAGLRTLHHSAVEFDEVESFEDLKAKERGRLDRIANALEGEAGEAAEGVREFLVHAGEGIETLEPFEPVPIHGAFGMACVRHQGDELFFHRFEYCRRSHPGLDFGAFLMDLADFARQSEASQEVARVAKDAFYGAYFGSVAPPSKDVAAVFVRIALLERIDRYLDGGQGNSSEGWLSEAHRLITACE